MDKYKIDSHKLIYHISRVHQWLKGENIYPIYLEIGLHGGCNHRCIFCAFDFLKYRPNILDEVCLKNFILTAVKKGTKAILYSGEGEPLLYKNAKNIIVFTKESGIDVALSTNGVMFNREIAKASLGSLSWIRVSLNAGTGKNYGIIHGTKKEDFDIVIDNLSEVVKIRDKNKYKCTIGVQFLLISQNFREVIHLSRILQDIGVDYLVIKPYCQHPLSDNKISVNFKYKTLFRLEKKLEKFTQGNFQIIFRRRAMEKLKEKKSYKYCLGLPFAAHITAEGSIYPCNAFVGKEEFVFGNICRESFENIWEGERRKRIMDIIYTKWDVKDCRKICRLDEINRYLWELKNPSRHNNFI